MRLVVGVNGSAAATAALEWAVRQAGRDGDHVLVVTAWLPPRGASDAGLVARRQAVTRVQRLQVARALVASGARPVVATEIILADPVTALCHAGRAADLVVVGGTANPDPTSISARVAHRIAAHRPEPVRLDRIRPHRSGQCRIASQRVHSPMARAPTAAPNIAVTS